MYVVGRELRKQALESGATVVLRRDVETRSDRIATTWLDDGTIIYGQTGWRLVRVDAESGEVVQLLYESGVGEQRAVWVHGLPGGRAVLVGVCRDNECTLSQAHVNVLDLEDGSMRPLLERALRGWLVPTGHIVYVAGDGSMWAAPFEPRALEISGPGVPLFDGVRTTGGRAPAVLAEDGTLVYVTGSPSPDSRELVWIDRSGRQEPVDPSERAANFHFPRLSPDDRHVAVAISEGGTDELWMKRLPDGPLTRLTDHAASNVHPTDWSRDGRTIAYVTNPDGPFRALAIRADPSALGASVPLVAHYSSAAEVRFTAEGRGMIVRGADSTGAFIHHVDLEVEREPIVLASGFNVRQPDVSADERWIAYVSDASGRGEVVVRSLAPDADGLVQVSREGGARPAWARNGREIFYVEPSTNRLIVAEYVADPTFAVRGREPLFQFPNLGGASFDVASDDERFLIVRPVAPDSAAQVNPPRLVIVENWFTELRQRLAATP